MKYFKYAVKEGTTYIEVEDGWANRIITIGEEPAIASNTNHPRWGPALPEGRAFFDDVEGLWASSKEEFDTIWSQHLERRRPWWEAAKAEYQLGESILGTILCFYPEGVLLSLGTDIIGIAEYEKCRASAHPELLRPRLQIKATVSSYDEGNQWIRLEDPQVLPKQL